MIQATYAKTHRKKALEILDECGGGFVSIDPGKYGCAFRLDVPGYHVSFGQKITDLAQYAHTVVCERPYLGDGNSERAMIEFAVTTGMQVGAFRPTRVLWVPPAAWQHALLGSKMQRASLKAMSIARCKAELLRKGLWHLWPELHWQQEAFADAWNISQWFLGLK